jgi:dephospho-CoA kinase
MLKIGLTGNIGSGKSAVSKVFGILGVPVFHADEESKNFLGDPEVLNRLVDAFGLSMLAGKDTVNRKALSDLVFRDPASLKTLNGIMHPLVMDRFSKWCVEHSDNPYVVCEAAIIFESGIGKEFDRIIDVDCPEETAFRRVMERDGVSREDVMKRAANQLDREAKASRSDFIIKNEGSEMIIPQVLEIHKKIQELSRDHKR